MDELDDLRAENERLQQWVHDCQAGMYINCVYCGHRYGPDDEVPATMADVLKEHIERCPKHPMSMLRLERDLLVEAVQDVLPILKATDSLQQERLFDAWLERPEVRAALEADGESE